MLSEIDETFVNTQQFSSLPQFREAALPKWLLDRIEKHFRKNSSKRYNNGHPRGRGRGGHGRHGGQNGGLGVEEDSVEADITPAGVVMKKLNPAVSSKWKIATTSEPAAGIIEFAKSLFTHETNRKWSLFVCFRLVESLIIRV